jgi:hypothetical protein
LPWQVASYELYTNSRDEFHKDMNELYTNSRDESHKDMNELYTNSRDEFHKDMNELLYTNSRDEFHKDINELCTNPDEFLRGIWDLISSYCWYVNTLYEDRLGFMVFGLAM